MSSAIARALPVPEQPARRERHLRALGAPERRRRPKLVYALTAVLGAVLIGAAQLALSIATTQTTYEIRELTEQQRSLTVQSQQLFDDVAGLSSPQYLAANATSMGMIVGGSPTFLRLSDGAVIGTGEGADASSITVAGSTNVPNALIADTPLVTTAAGAGQGETAPAETQPTQELPPAISDGLPTPQTR